MDEWTIAIEGAAIAAMPEDKRWCTTLTEPKYKIDENKDNPKGNNKAQLLSEVKLSDGRVATYYWNLTSARFVANRLGTDLKFNGMTDDEKKKWIGIKLIWGKVLDQNVMGQMKKVIYVTDVK